MLGLFVLCTSALALEESPDALIKRVTEDVLTIVRQDKDIQSGNTKKAIALVEAKVLPHFNFLHMTALAVGRDWREATPEQKKQLAEEFKTLLVRTEIVQSGAKPIALDYSVEKLPDGWKVYDVVVAGVSLVSNYRDTFAQEIRANKIDGLIKMLANKNKQNEASKT